MLNKIEMNDFLPAFHYSSLKSNGVIFDENMFTPSGVRSERFYINNIDAFTELVQNSYYIPFEIEVIHSDGGIKEINLYYNYENKVTVYVDKFNQFDFPTTWRDILNMMNSFIDELIDLGLK